MSNDPDYEATQRERAQKRRAAKRLRLDAENQIAQSRSVKELTAENSRLRAEVEKAHRAGFSAGLEAGAKCCELPAFGVDALVDGTGHKWSRQPTGSECARRIRAIADATATGEGK